MKATNGSTPPADLSPAAKRWWLEVISEYELESSHVHLLTLAARALDRGEEARKILRRGGLSFRDDHGVLRIRPEVTVEKASAVLFARLLRELRLDVSPPDDRPPRLGQR